jgi:hypothetical protein
LLTERHQLKYFNSNIKQIRKSILLKRTKKKKMLQQTELVFSKHLPHKIYCLCFTKSEASQQVKAVKFSQAMSHADTD